ncbi:MAG: ATP-binding cassette domain-containing protein [Tissierellia bacterium]|nr:ATP-binding cassette domain-containing protein [Tissierellia bacterium]
MSKQEQKEILLKIEDLKQYFPVGKKSFFGKGEQLYVRANDGVTVNIYKGETLGLVGESGCGKSTLGRSILQLYEQTDGRTMYYGTNIYEVNPKYVKENIKNYPENKKKFIAAESEKNKKIDEIEKISDETEKLKAIESLKDVEKKARHLFYDIIELAGAMVLVKDDEKVSKLLMEEFNLNCELTKIKNSVKPVIANGEPTKELSADQINKIAELEKKLERNKADMDQLLGTVKDNPNFEAYSAEKGIGVNLANLEDTEMREIRDQLQLIFQDPYSSLNPRLTVGQIISEGLNAHPKFKNMENKQDYILKIMEDCGLAPYFIHRYPHQFSGGQRQRIGIARSVALQPEFIVCDEAVSALDVSIQSQIINLLLDLKEKDNLTYLFISHDLSVIKYISDRVAVMYLGNIVELADTGELYSHPMHPYTEALLAAIPTTDSDNRKEIQILEGDIPSPIRPPKGCKFHTRCKYADEICNTVTPVLEEKRPGHFVACHHHLNEE